MSEIEALAPEQFCYLTTVGRVSGKPHTIEIWFAVERGGSTLYMLSGGGEQSDWVKNILRNPAARLRIGRSEFTGRGWVVVDDAEERLARRLVVAKYYGREEVKSEGWEAIALPVAIDLDI